MHSPSDCSISLETNTSLDKEAVKVWYRCIKANAPNGVMRPTQALSPDGLKAVALIHTHKGGSHVYTVPLTRHLTEGEGERIVAAYEAPQGLEYDIAVSSPIEQPDAAGEPVVIENERYIALCTAWAKRQHEVWAKDRFDAGWRYGTQMSLSAKTHPLLRSWDQLALEQRGIDFDAPQLMIDLLNAEGYAVVSKAEVDAIKNLLRQQSLTTIVERQERAPMTLLRFIQASGGMRDTGGNLKAAGFGRYPGLINNRAGIDPDRMREQAAEAGYLGADTDQAMADTDVNDLLDAISRHPVYSVHDLDARLNRNAKIGRSTQREQTQVRRKILDDLVYSGMDLNDIDFETVDAAAWLVIDKGVRWEDAYASMLRANATPSDTLPHALVGYDSSIFERRKK